MNGTGVFINRNSDKLLVMAVMFIFLGLCWRAYSHGMPGFGDALIDLVKQLTAAFLTLVVSKAVTSTRENGNGKSGNGAPAATVMDTPKT